ncbi:HlyD family secretion protein [Mariniphaga anaerophila]|uniref:HlyD family secretion protein n=1 Tax=Mariniphaga anaerophila TaxID=1484053 RepID=A0A1M4TLS1_9BACT|nr:efflux RND transporter periplasmic adaptor subunit [Mariniphaga anaerophila]SHE45355.1 HlyD family secretion protein [Mariniphaga anaerophila]
MKKKTIIITTGIIILLAALFFILKPSKVDAGKIHIETAQSESGTISKTVTATGTLEALSTVEVGTQVSGIIEDIFVDFNSYVKRGQLLAKIDTTNLAAAMEQSQASLDNAKAELDYQLANYNRLAPINDKKLVSQADFDQTVYNLNKARASYNSALAQHKKNKINLDYALIYSPIDGIVLDRAVEEGQTVAASFNTPTLFTIANDLTQMKVEADVDEADIGEVKEGQRVEFTVDAYPDQVFEGEVTQVRLQPTVTNNVVTYSVIISAHNPDYKLLPGMTAEINIFVIEKKDILVVPSKALRFNPDEKLLASYMKSQPRPEMPENGAMPGGPGNQKMQPPTMEPAQTEGSGVVWVKKDSIIRPVPVKTGLDDDIHAEIINGLQPGEEVILSMEVAEPVKSPEQTNGGNPFMPRPPRARK